MPTTETSTLAVEKSTFVVTAAFTDEDDDAVIPNSGLTWTLTDISGNVINSRTAVAIASAASVNIVLSGLDLAIQSATDNKLRVLLVEGTYDSALGNNLPILDQFKFMIADLAGIAAIA